MGGRLGPLIQMYTFRWLFYKNNSLLSPLQMHPFMTFTINSAPNEKRDTHVLISRKSVNILPSLYRKMYQKKNSKEVVSAKITPSILNWIILIGSLITVSMAELGQSASIYIYLSTFFCVFIIDMKNLVVRASIFARN